MTGSCERGESRGRRASVRESGSARVGWLRAGPSCIAGSGRTRRLTDLGRGASPEDTMPLPRESSDGNGTSSLSRTGGPTGRPERRRALSYRTSSQVARPSAAITVDPLLHLANAALNLMGKRVAQPEHQERGQRCRHHVGHQQLERRQLENAGGQVGGRAKTRHESARDQDLEAVPVKVPLDLGFPLPGQEPAGQREAENLLAVEETQEVDDQIAKQDPDQATRQGQRPLASCRFDSGRPPG